MGERGEDIVGDVRQREAVLGKFEKRVLVLLHHGRVLILEFVEHAGQQYLCLPGPFLAEALGERPGRRARLAHARDVGILGDDFLERPGDVAVVAGCEPRRVRELLQPRHGVQAFLPLGGVHRVPELRGLLVLRLLLELVEDGFRVGKLVRVGESRGGVRRDDHRAVAAVHVHGVDASRVRRRVGLLLAREPLTNRAANLDGFRGGLHLRLHGAPHLLDQIPAHGIVAEPPGELHGEILRRAANLGVLGVEQGRDSLEDRLGRHHRGRPEFLHGDAHGLDARERELGNLVRGSLQQRVHHCIAALQLQQQHARLRGAIHRLGSSAHALRDDICEDARRVRPGVVLVRDGEERVESIEAEVKCVGVGISGGVLSALACGLGSGLRVRDLRCCSRENRRVPRGDISPHLPDDGSMRARGPALSLRDSPKAFKHALDAISCESLASLTTHSYAATRAFQNECLNLSSHGSLAASASCVASSSAPMVAERSERGYRPSLSPPACVKRVSRACGVERLEVSLARRCAAPTGRFSKQPTVKVEINPRS